MLAHVRHGRGAVRPYLYGALELPQFLREVFGAEEVERDVPGRGHGRRLARFTEVSEDAFDRLRVRDEGDDLHYR